MNKNALILIQSDPRTTPRPCEGIRIALGLASSGHQVEVVLTKEGIRLLETEKHDYIDAENLERFFLALTEVIPYFLIDQTGHLSHKPVDPSYEIKFLSKEALASRISSSDVFFTF